MITTSWFCFDSQLVSFDGPKSIEFDRNILEGVLSVEADMLNPGGLTAASGTNIALLSSSGSTTPLAGKKWLSINLMINF